MSYSLVIDVLAKLGAISDALETEHELILFVTSRLNQAIASGAEQGVIIHLVDIIDEECRSHFAHEEKYMSECGAANLENHAKAHQRLLERTRKVRSAIFRRDPLGIPDAVDLLHSLENHINHLDRSAYKSARPMAKMS
jgi:hemerythrin-like metal-binding protein